MPASTCPSTTNIASMGTGPFAAARKSPASADSSWPVTYAGPGPSRSVEGAQERFALPEGAEEERG